MTLENIAVLTTKNSWFEPYASQLVEKILEEGYHSDLFFNAEEVPDRFEVVFMLSVYGLVKKKDLVRHKHNLVIHPSDLPKGKGWAPLAWQILEGKNEIPIVLFEAAEAADAGPIYLRDMITLNGGELNDEIRQKQGEKLIEMSLRFIKEYEQLTPTPQSGDSTYYERRTSKHSEIDTKKPLIEQMNLLRVCCNREYPAFFYHQGQKYILKIFKGES